MTAKVGKKKLVLIADMTPAPKQEDTYTTPWGKVWTHGADVMTTWRRHGFVPPTEYRNDYRFKINRECGELND
jgi:hypothetical protein